MQDRSRFGHVLETFVYRELLKHATTADGDYQLLYYHDHDQFEVDIVIKNAVGQVVGVDIKATATVRQADLRVLKRLANIAGNQFKLGVILYDATETLPFGERLWAAPISTLWGNSTSRVGCIGSCSTSPAQSSFQPPGRTCHAEVKKARKNCAHPVCRFLLELRGH